MRDCIPEAPVAALNMVFCGHLPLQAHAMKLRRAV
jgi:hypothetical protein